MRIMFRQPMPIRGRIQRRSCRRSAIWCSAIIGRCRTTAGISGRSIRAISMARLCLDTGRWTNWAGCGNFHSANFFILKTFRRQKMRSFVLLLITSWVLAVGTIAQSTPTPSAQNQTASQSEEQPKPSAKAKKAQEPAAKPEAATAPPEDPKSSREGTDDKDKGKEEHFDVSEVAPVVTHHQMTLNGKSLKYTATAGRLPIKRPDGKIEAEMFFVAYTLDGQDASTRPLTFAFNGGPGSASVWLHMGALGPRKVVLQPDGFMPAAPFRVEDNPDTLLDRSDIVMVDAMATGYSRAANAELTKKFLGVRGDVQAFGEFIRLYLSRYERWGSPLFLLGESYGTTRAAGLSGYLADHGIAFNGVTLLSTAVDFATLEWNDSNDLPSFLLVPSYSMIAAYHHKLAADLTGDINKT